MKVRFRGGSVAIGAAVALGIVAVVGGRLYESAVTSASLQRQIESACPATSGIYSSYLEQSAVPIVDGRASSVPLIRKHLTTRLAGPNAYTFDGDDGGSRGVLLFHRDGQETALPAADRLGDGEVLLPEQTLAGTGLAPGDVIDVALVRLNSTIGSAGDSAGSVRLTIAGGYSPPSPDSDFWCSASALFAPSAGGDPPRNSVGLVSSRTMASLPKGVAYAGWEAWVDGGAMRADTGRSTAQRLDAAVKGLEQQIVMAPGTKLPGDQLRLLVERSTAVAAVVRRTIDPILVASALTALTLLAAAARLRVRENRRELSLRVRRGVGPIELAIGELRAIAGPVGAGTVIGVATAFALVRVFAPSPDVEPSAAITSLLRAAIVGAVGWCGLALLIGRLAHARTRSAVRRRVLAAFALLVLCALAVWSFLRLDRVGGVRLLGADAKGGDLLAQAFPLLGALAVLVLLAPIVSTLLSHGRRIGARLPRGLLLGWRRLGVEPLMTTLVVTAAALAASCIAQAEAQTRTTRQALLDKAQTFIGADASIGVNDPEVDVSGLGAAATLVSRSQTRSGKESVDLLGVDAGSFVETVRWRTDGAGESLRTLLSRLGPVAADGSVPAIVVGGALKELTVRPNSGSVVTLKPVGSAAFFPGQTAGARLVVLDRSAMRQLDIGQASVVWVREPVDRPDQILRDRGVKARLPLSADRVFDATSFLTVRWSYDVIRAFGVLIAFVAVMAQLLVLRARRRSREAASVLTRRMGMSTSDDAVAHCIDIGVPLVGGTAIGSAIGAGVAAVAVARLDSLRNLSPPARLVTSPMLFLVAIGIAVVVSAIVSAFGVRGLRRVRPMEVLRGGE